MKANHQHARRVGFTLIEMLVVITIIGILASILVPTLAMAIRKSREGAIAIEINQLAMAMQEYKNQMGAFPPDNSAADQDLNPVTLPAPQNMDINKYTLIRHLNKVTNNKHRETSATLDLFVDRVDPAEALVFWLSGTKKNVELPLSPLPPGSNPNPPSDFRTFFEFDETRIRDLDGDGFYEYIPPYGAEVPYVYFSFHNYGTNTGGNVIASRGYDGRTAGPEGNGRAMPFITDTNKFQEAESFQIICAGYDGHFGGDPTIRPLNFDPPNNDHRYRLRAFPSGRNFEPENFDDIASFADGRVDSEID